MMCRAFSITFLFALGCVAFSGQTPPVATTPAIPRSAMALVPPAAIGDTLHLQSHIASFKIVERGEDLPAGTLNLNFQGTVLVSGLAPGSYLQTSGDVREEYESKPHGKQVYFGRGKLILVGKFKSCEWFGRDLDMTFKGAGIVRVISEFDKKLETGHFWFDPTRKQPLQTQLIPIVVPEVRIGPEKAIKREDFNRLHPDQAGG